MQPCRWSSEDSTRSRAGREISLSAKVSLDFAYIDGDHSAAAILEDAVLLFRLLKRGGVLLFDDYRRADPNDSDPLNEPKIAIDAFLEIYDGRYELLHKDWLVAVRVRT